MSSTRPGPHDTVVVAYGGECTVNLALDAGRAREQGLSLRKGLVDHAMAVLLAACGDAVLTGTTLINADDLIVIGVS